ncbi:MAG: flagellar hook-basal body protein [Bacillota bacterium]
MIQSLYTAATGAKNQQLMIDTIANNVANINTDGFKYSRVTFQDAMYQTMRSPIQPQGDKNLELGHGVLLSDTAMNFVQGAMRSTGETLDFALDGDGFFTVANAQNETMYTRCGMFSVSVEDDGTYLVTAQGYYVLSDQGERIKLPSGTENITCNSAGVLSGASGNPFATLGIAAFDNMQGLEKKGDNLYAATEASGQAKKADDVTVKQGYIESSNVDLAEEMTKLIRAQRAYSLISRAITTADEMESAANNLRK